MKTQELRKLIREEVRKEVNKQKLNEVGVGTIALGVMVAVFGIKLMGVIAKKVLKFATLNSAEYTKERTPEELKKVLEQITSDALKSANLMGGDAGKLMAEVLILRTIGDKIDGGQIKTLKQLLTEFQVYVKSII